MWLHSSVGRASHRYRGGHGFESRWSPDFFRLLLSSCLYWKIYCDDHSSLSSTTAVHIWIISYKLHICSTRARFADLVTGTPQDCVTETAKPWGKWDFAIWFSILCVLFFFNPSGIFKNFKFFHQVVTGAIIGDGDRKSWDPRAPMIWDNFSILRTNNCAILTSYIRADPRTCRGFSRGCCHVAWSNGESSEILLQIFHSDGRE